MLGHIARSDKPNLKTQQIGRLGIGLLAFQRFASKATFHSRKSRSEPTIKIVLREGQRDYNWEIASKKDSLPEPGMAIVIEELKVNPLGVRSALGKDRLKKVIGGKFSSPITTGRLEVAIRVGTTVEAVAATAMDLPPLAEGYSTCYVHGDRSKKVLVQLGYDSRGAGKVSIRNAGVVVVDSISSIEGEGLESSVFAGGYVTGFIDADFLMPSPARAGFELNEDWDGLVKCLKRMEPSVEAEVNQHRTEEEDAKLTSLAREAVTLAREILEQEEYSDLLLLGGQVRARGENTGTRSHPTGQRTGERSRQSGDRADSKGFRVSFNEVGFEDSTTRHSRYLRATGVVEVNVRNKDYRDAKSRQDALSYGAIMIGKETITYNSEGPAVDDSMEKLLSFIFDVRRKIIAKPSRAG